MTMEPQTPWWQSATIYHIYPRSFQDGNGDGVGDLPGITTRLDYLADLGVDALWLSPIYPSPMADFGYDVSDFCDIHPLFGSLADFDQLVTEAHARKLRVILDCIPNHSSHRHPWFLAAQSGRQSPYRDWYLWRDPAPDGGVPNNWLSEFGGPAWTLDEASGQYYYHAYLPEQPDFNWRHPEVREAMFQVLRFWLDRGVDGFRLDAFRRLVKDAQFRDEPDNPDFRPGVDNPAKQRLPIRTTEQPELFDIVRDLRALVDEYHERVLIGELYLPIPRLMPFYGTAEAPGIHLPGNFHLLMRPWKAEALAALIQEYQAALPPHGWPNWVLGNHDNHRLATRLGPQARVAAMFLLTQRGTPTLYYGDELGMTDVPIPVDRVQDPWERNVPGQGFGRDPERTPMQWDDSPHAGFSPVEPWLPVAADAAQVNVACQRDDPRSMLSLYRRLLALRRTHPALALGAIDQVRVVDACLCYRRHHQGENFLVVLNLGDGEVRLEGMVGRVLLSTGLDRQEAVSGVLALAPHEGLVLILPTRTP